MATVFTPTWTDGTAIRAITTLAKGAVSRSTYAMPAKRGGYLTLFIMRTGATALDVSIKVNVRRLSTATPPLHQAPIFSAASEIIAAVSGVAAASGNNAGTASLTINAAKTYVANSTGFIYIAVLDSITVPTLASEILRQSIATSTTVKLLEWPMESSHNDITHVVTDQCNLWTVWVDAGESIEVDFDYGLATTGDTVVIGAYINTYDSDLGT